MLTPQQQQIVLAQGNLSSPSGASVLNEIDSSNLRMICSGKNAPISKDGQSNAVGDMVNNTGSPMQVASPLSRDAASDPDFVFKMKLAFQQHQQQQLLTQQAQPTQQSQVVHPDQQQDKSGVVLTVDSSLSNSFHANDQVYNVMEPSPSTNSIGTGKASSKSQAGRKRKQPGSLSGPAISSRTVNNTVPSTSSPPSTTSSHTPSNVMSMAGALQHSGDSSKPMILYGSDGTLASPSASLRSLSISLSPCIRESSIPTQVGHVLSGSYDVADAIHSLKNALPSDSRSALSWKTREKNTANTNLEGDHLK